MPAEPDGLSGRKALDLQPHEFFSDSSGRVGAAQRVFCQEPVDERSDRLGKAGSEVTYTLGFCFSMEADELVGGGRTEWQAAGDHFVERDA